MVRRSDAVTVTQRFLASCCCKLPWSGRVALLVLLGWVEVHHDYLPIWNLGIALWPVSFIKSLVWRFKSICGSLEQRHIFHVPGLLFNLALVVVSSLRTRPPLFFKVSRVVSFEVLVLKALAGRQFAIACSPSGQLVVELVAASRQTGTS